MYIVIDFYDDPSGEIIYRSSDYGRCKKFAKVYAKGVDGDCWLKIFKEME